MKGLQSEAAEDESDAEGAKPSFREVVGIVFDKGVHRYADAGDNARHQPYTDCEQPGMLQVANQGATDKRCGRETNCSY